MKNILVIFCLPLWVFLFSSSVFAADFEAKVIHITDGDTITVLNDTNEQIKIRLNGIDSPEKWPSLWEQDETVYQRHN
jgi:endonuclease YncB( thermonuclease family)